MDEMKNGGVDLEMNSPATFGENMTDTITQINDQTVHLLVQEFLSRDWMDMDGKLYALDSLTYMIWNYHPDGMCAYKALNEVSSAIDEVLGL